METLDQALGHASGCVRLKMARGDCLAHLGRYCGLQMALMLNLPLYNISGNNCDFRYVDGAKAASSILQQDQRHVGALFLRYFEIVAQICCNFFTSLSSKGFLPIPQEQCGASPHPFPAGNLRKSFTSPTDNLTTNFLFRFCNSRKDMSGRRLCSTRRGSSRRRRRRR